MESAKNADRNAVSDLDFIVDAGTRVKETVDEILQHMDDSYAAKTVIGHEKRRPQGTVYSGVSSYPMYEYKRRDSDGDSITDGDIDDPISTADTASMADDLGIDIGIVNPALNEGLSEVNNARFAVALASAYNNWLVTELAEHDNLKGNIVIAPHEPERAAEEIDRMAGEDDIVGIQFPATGISPPPGKRIYTPIYEAAERHGLPISMRATVGLKEYSQQYYWAESFAEDYVNHPSWVHIRNVTSLVFEGVPVRFPDLDFVLQGAGIGYVPYTILRLDDHYLELGYEIPALEKLPSKYLEESFYWCTSPLGHADAEYVARMIQMIGVENVLYDSDIPFSDRDSPTALQAHLREEFSDEEQAAIFGETATSIFGL